ncbi:MAG: sigma 54-interacting transcriptional regulator [Candidatus Eisenbacteria bacterium]|nr:sigma 54-interacting transcriptional regulator [Candidatus Eisenbacteria bacterium]
MKPAKPTDVRIREDRIAAKPRDFRRLLDIGDVHLGADDSVSALEYYERALVLARDSGADPGVALDIELRIIEALRRRGHQLKALELAESVVARQDARRDPISHARAVGRLGMVQSALHRYDAAKENCAAAYQVLRNSGANEDVAVLELTLGVVAHFTGRMADARVHYESALSTFRRVDDSDGIARALNNLGTLLINTPRWREAKEYLARAVSVAEEGGNYARIASLCLNLGILCYKTGEWELGSKYLGRALAISKDTAPFRVIKCHVALGRMKLRRREFVAAEAHFHQALDAARERGQTREEALSLEFLGEHALREGDYERARSYLEQGKRIAVEVAPANDVVGEIESRLAELEMVTGHPDRARVVADNAVRITTGINDSVEVGRSLRIRGEAELALGLRVEARASLDESVRILDGTPDVIERELARVARAKLWACSSGSGDEAGHSRRPLMSLEQSVQRFLDLELPEFAVECLEEIAQMTVAESSPDEALVAVDRALDLVERHRLGKRKSELLRLRSDLEERCAESSLSRSVELQVLRDMSAFGVQSEADSVETFLRLATERSRADRVLLAVRSRREGIRIVASTGFDGALPSKAVLVALLDGLDGGNRVLVVGDPRRDPRFSLSGEFGETVGSAVAVPLPISGRETGLLYADRVEGAAQGRFRVGDLRLLSFFAGMIAVVMGTHASGRKQSDESTNEPAQDDALVKFLTCNADMRNSLKLLRRLDGSGAGVLVTGETGTGKGLLSRLIHDASQRRHAAFVPINCAALPESLLESELFGHEQGAFTGAVRSKRGLFEEAEGGTLFLDEVDKAPIGVQAKLLHVLDKHEIRPVGSTQWKPVDVRVVCATNADLAAAIQAGRFLEDLYYRLNDFQVHIPPLRERREDIPLLVRHFVDEFRRTLGRPNVTLSREVVRFLTECEWRGNVRELEKVIKRMIVLAEDGDELGIDSLPREIRVGQRDLSVVPDGQTLRAAIERLEAQMIGSTLEGAGGNKSEVARRLQISYPSLLSKIRKYRLEPRRR